jgi:leucyl-tRNA synthetase
MIMLPEVERSTLTLPDRWMLSRLQEHIRAATEALDTFETRKAVQHVFFSLLQDLKWYTKRVKEDASKAHVLRRVLDAWVRLLAPFAPHTCEELWHRMGGSGFVFAADWPRVDEKLVDAMAEFSEDYLSRVIDDLGEVLSVVKLEKPNRICLYVAQDWRWKAYRMAIERVRDGKVNIGELIRTATKELGVRQYAAELAKYIQRIVQDLRVISQEQLAILAKVEIDELQVLADSADFMAKQFGVEMVQVFKADEQARFDPQDRARFAVPLRPAIYVE